MTDRLSPYAYDTDSVGYSPRTEVERGENVQDRLALVQARLQEAVLMLDDIQGQPTKGEVNKMPPAPPGIVTLSRMIDEQATDILARLHGIRQTVGRL